MAAGGGLIEKVDYDDCSWEEALALYPHGRGSWMGCEDYRLERVKKTESLT
jgi:hypothetical protein